MWMHAFTSFGKLTGELANTRATTHWHVAVDAAAVAAAVAWNEKHTHNTAYGDRTLAHRRCIADGMLTRNYRINGNKYINGWLLSTSHQYEEVRAQMRGSVSATRMTRACR